MRLAGSDPVGLSLTAFAAAAEPVNPPRRPAVNREAEVLGDRRQRVAIGGMQPLGAAVQRKPGWLDRMHATADPVAGLEHQHREPIAHGEPSCCPYPRRTGADYRNIDLRPQRSHSVLVSKARKMDYRARVGDASAISLTSLLVIASAKEWKSSMTRKKAPGPPMTFCRYHSGNPPGGWVWKA